MPPQSSSARRDDILRLAKEKLSEVRTAQRRLSETHLEARMSMERLSGEVLKWRSLRERLRENADALRSIVVMPALPTLLSTSPQELSHEAALLQERLNSLRGSRGQLDVEHASSLSQIEADIRCTRDELEEVEREYQAFQRAKRNVEAMCAEVREAEASVAAVVAQSQRESALVEDARQEENAALADKRSAQAMLDEAMSSQEKLATVVPSQEVSAISSECAFNDGLEVSKRRQEVVALEETLKSFQLQRKAKEAEHEALGEVLMERQRLDDTNAILARASRHLEALRQRHVWLTLLLTKSELLQLVQSSEVNITMLEGQARSNPTLDELRLDHIPTLERQVETLTCELGRTTEDLYLLQDEGVVKRCLELQDCVDSYDTVTIPALQRRLQELKEQRFELKRLLKCWEEEEAPRHNVFHEQLDSELRAGRDALISLSREQVRLEDHIDNVLSVERNQWDEVRAEWASQDKEWADYLEHSATGLCVEDMSSEERQGRFIGDADTADDDDDVVEIVDAGNNGAIRTVRVPHPVKPQFLRCVEKSPSATAAVEFHLPSSVVRMGKSVSTLVQLPTRIVRSFWELVRGRSVEVPGGGVTLTLDI